MSCSEHFYIYLMPSKEYMNRIDGFKLKRKVGDGIYILRRTEAYELKILGKQDEVILTKKSYFDDQSTI